MIVAFANQKGGVAKTTTTVNVGAYLAMKGRRVLLVDADPQASLSVYLDKRQGGMDAVIEGHTGIADIAVKIDTNLTLAPSSIYLASTELSLMGGFNREYRLRSALSIVADSYDHILIDCPPSLGILTVNALAAAQTVGIVMSTDVLAFEGVRLLYDSLQALKKQINPSLSILGLIRTRYDGRTIHASILSTRAAELLREHLRIFDTVINERVALKDAAAAHQSIYDYAPNSQAANEYGKLSQEILHVIEKAN